jgi:large subunit ribosomal protein L28
MSCKCELSGVGVQHGNMVSHSQRKTRRKYRPNLQSMTFFSQLTRKFYSFRVSARCIKSIDKAGGFDSYMIKSPISQMSNKASIAKRGILKISSSEVAV